ncbi:hypothetical protein C1H46_032872 [Malus baccata]|uniref:Beta-glucosidase n=1 Tax=Malus baccata TaxID=106549 RepID=A0A540L515_MALBA|nr:hypothetical protein C1H46_032872 [Malus baccata]
MRTPLCMLPGFFTIQCFAHVAEHNRASVLELESVKLDADGLSRASFRKGFVFGMATSVYQVEGMDNKEGRGPSIWDAFVKIPRIIVNNDLITADPYLNFSLGIEPHLNFSYGRLIRDEADGSYHSGPIHHISFHLHNDFGVGIDSADSVLCYAFSPPKTKKQRLMMMINYVCKQYMLLISLAIQLMLSASCPKHLLINWEDGVSVAIRMVVNGSITVPPSPVFTEALKFQNPLPNGCSRTPWRMLAKPSSSLTSMGGHNGGGKRRRGLGRLRVASDGSPSTHTVADDYYTVLGLLPDETKYGQRGLHTLCSAAQQQ